MNRMCICAKQVDSSVLDRGFTVPAGKQRRLLQLGFEIGSGEARPVKLRIDGVLYDAVLKNQIRGDGEGGGLRQVLQFRYKPVSRTAERFRDMFHRTYDYVMTERECGRSGRANEIAPEHREYVGVYTTPNPDVFEVNTIRREAFQAVHRPKVKKPS